MRRFFKAHRIYVFILITGKIHYVVILYVYLMINSLNFKLVIIYNNNSGINDLDLTRFNISILT